MSSVASETSAPFGLWLKTWYFSVVSGLTLALTLLGFSDNLFTDVGQPSNQDPKFIIHGLLCLAWMIVFAAQANLARTGRFHLHRRLGVAGMVIAVGVTLSTIHVFVAVWQGWDAMPPYLKGNRLLIPSFGLFVLAAWLWRRRGDWHKRLLCMATLFMLEPVLSRSFDPFAPLMMGMSDSRIDVYWWIYFVAVWLGFWLSLLVYDAFVLRRIHPATLGGFAWFMMIWLFVSIV